jgi:hypothetical protein
MTPCRPLRPVEGYLPVGVNLERALRRQAAPVQHPDAPGSSMEDRGTIGHHAPR